MTSGAAEAAVAVAEVAAAAGRDPTRRRLVAAMGATVARHGYAGATVARVAAAAGVSRATFYECFTGREQCFLAAYRFASGRLGAAVHAAAAASGLPGRPAAVLDALFDVLAVDPATARLIFVEAFAAPSRLREEHERVVVSLEDRLADFLDRQPRSAAIQIPAGAMLAGVGDVLAMRALPGATQGLPVLQADLASWIDSYRLPPGGAPLPQSRWRALGRFAELTPAGRRTEPALLPRGRSALPPALGARQRRGRILDAVARLAADEGYSALTVGAVAEAARVPRAAFYSHFACKHEALLAAQTHSLQGAMAAAAAAYSPAGPWPERVWRAVEALLVYVAAHPDYAALGFVESYAAGEESIRHRHHSQMAFALFLEDGYREAARTATPPRIASEAIAGAVFGLIRGLVVAGAAERLLSLLPAATYTILAPFIGARRAADEVLARAPRVS